jgi:hypothetical protein
MNYYVYAHLNPKTNEIFYIGLGTGKRKNEFKSGRNKHYINYVKKYGFPLVEILKENLIKEEACSLEIELITKYGRRGIEPKGILLNKSKGGEGGNLGIKQSQETRDKKSKSMLGKCIHSLEQKQKWSQTRKNKKNNWDPNHIKADKGRKKPKDFAGKGLHPISQYDLQGNFIKQFSSMKEVTETLNISSSSLWAHIKGITKKSGGYIWKSNK